MFHSKLNEIINGGNTEVSLEFIDEVRFADGEGHADFIESESLGIVGLKKMFDLLNLSWQRCGLG